MTITTISLHIEYFILTCHNEGNISFVIMNMQHIIDRPLALMYKAHIRLNV